MCACVRVCAIVIACSTYLNAPHSPPSLYFLQDIDKLSVACMQVLFDSAEAAGKDGTKTSVGAHVSATSGSGNKQVSPGSNNHSSSSSSTVKAPAGAAETSVAAALAQSRAVCKMGYAVGAAPVMYGLPTKMTT